MNAQTKTTAVATVEHRSVINDMAEKFGMAPTAFEATIIATCFPVEKDRPNKAEFCAFLSVAKEYGLNPITREIYGFRAKSGAIVPIVGVDGWVNLVNSHGAANGVEFTDNVVNGKVDSITCRVWRKDREKPIEVTEYMEECKRDTDPWKRWPRRMLRHKALIQAARYAFGFSGFYDPDEAERIDEATAPRAEPPNPDDTPPAAKAPTETVDEETGEVTETVEWVDEVEADAEAKRKAAKAAKAPRIPTLQEVEKNGGDPDAIPPGLRRSTTPIPADFNEANWAEACGKAAAAATTIEELAAAQALHFTPHEAKASAKIRKIALGAFTYRAEELSAPEEFDGAQWLRDLDGALSGCTEAGGLAEIKNKTLLEAKEKVTPEQWNTGVKAYRARVAELVPQDLTE